MKKLLLSCICACFVSSMYGQGTVTLEAPSKERGLSVTEALWERHSPREFDTTPLSFRDLSDLLWAANGINRPESGKRTAPSAMNAQDIDIYVFIETGVYLYDAAKHALIEVVTEDKRSVFSANEAEILPAVLCLLVSDVSRFRINNELKPEWAAFDAGIVSQNILLFASANNMVGRPRAFMNKDALKTLLNLPEHKLIMLNVPVSYKK